MDDFTALDLTAYSNGDAERVAHRPDVPVGAVQWQGIPFSVAGGDGARVLSLGNEFGSIEAQGDSAAGSLRPTDIEVNATARYVVFAHRLLDSSILEGGVFGSACADYVLRYTDGSEQSVPIRDRLEIGSIPCVWGQLPMLAYPDMDTKLLPESWSEWQVQREQPAYQAWPGSPTQAYPAFGGTWGDSGTRQREVMEPWPLWFYLWALENPRPEAKIATISIRPRGPRFLVGAITLVHAEAYPFNRSAKRSLRIDVDNAVGAGDAATVEVSVDRGVAGRVRRLPAEDPASALNAPLKGWGVPPNPDVTPGYVDVAAHQDAELVVKHNGETVSRVAWRDVLTGEASKPADPVRITVVEEGRNWVHTKVVDSGTGETLPSRVHFRSVDGVPYQPHGHHNHLNSDMGTWHVDVGGDVRLGQAVYAYTDGTCQGWLPRGKVVVDVARGFEYKPLRTVVEIEPGQRELVLPLERLRRMSDDRYFSGDTHVHFLSTQGAHVEAAAEGLNVVNLLASQWGHLFTEFEQFTGGPSIANSGETIVWASQENRQHMLGHLSLLGLKEPVMPWASDGPSEAELGGNLETTLSRWADACHEQGGTVVMPHFPQPNGEVAALVTTGRADAAEWLSQDRYMHQEYYRYLNAGYRLPIVGGTDKMSSDVALGMFRTYVHIPEDEPFDYDSWCKWLKRGNTFLTSGPLLFFSVDGQPAGSTINISGDGGTVEVAASAQSTIPIHCLEIVVNGEVVARTESASGTDSLQLHEHVTLSRHSWIAVRCGGPNYFDSTQHLDVWGRRVMAHTSPVYVAVGGEWWMFDAGSANYLVTILEGGLQYVRQRPLQWPADSVTHHHHHTDHMAFLEEPFQQAIAAVHARMHRLDIPH